MNTSVLLDFVSQPLGGVLNGYLDTLHSDYAFLITPEPFFKSLRLPQVEGSTVETDWDFSLYPNPTRDALFLKFQDDLPKDVVIMDVSGRRVAQYPTVTTTLLQLPTDLFAKGVYWVHVASGENRKVKKLIVH